MNIDDYIVDRDGIAWSEYLRDWAWLLPAEFTVWMVNRFCDLFVILPDGSVHMLDVGGGSITRVADNRDEFAAKLDIHANEWLMIPFVDKLVATGITLQAGQCYGFKLSPVLGGEYAIENCAAISVPDYLSCWGTLHRQMKDVPNGDQVVIEIVDSLPERERP